MKKFLLIALLCFPLCATAKRILASEYPPEMVRDYEVTPEMIAQEQDMVKAGSYGICVDAGNTEKNCKCFSEAIIEKFPPEYMFLLTDPDVPDEDVQDFIDWVATKPCNVRYPLYNAATGTREFLD